MGDLIPINNPLPYPLYKPEEDIKFECNNLGCDSNKEIFAKFTGNKSEISLNDMNDI